MTRSWHFRGQNVKEFLANPAVHHCAWLCILTALQAVGRLFDPDSRHQIDRWIAEAAAFPECTTGGANGAALSDARFGVFNCAARHGMRFERLTTTKPAIRLGFFTRLLDRADPAE